MHKLAVIGDADSILGFRALGLDIFPSASVEEASDILKQIGKQDYGVIFITEGLASEMMDQVTEYMNKALPVVITIPDNKGAKGAALEKIRRTVEKALGADILFSGKEKEGSNE